jgi:hypothetical protein
MQRTEHDDMSQITAIEESNQDLPFPHVTYPNPFNGVFFLSLPENLIISTGSYQIFDVMGQLVKEEMINKSKTTSIDLSVMSSGIYVLTLTFDEKKYNLELVKQ